MKNKEDAEVKNLLTQWFFVIVAAMLAFVLGIAVNAAYELLGKLLSPVKILILAAITCVFLIDALTYLFLDFSRAINDPQDTSLRFMGRYWKYRIGSLLFWKKKKIPSASS